MKELKAKNKNVTLWLSKCDLQGEEHPDVATSLNDLGFLGN
jgi:hypothetical protein